MPNLTPWLEQKFFLSDGVTPNAGGKVFTYYPGTSTKKPTYAGESAAFNTNPIILDSSGRCNLWLADGGYKIVNAPANDTDPPAAAIKTWDNINVSGTSGEGAGIASSIADLKAMAEGAFETVNVLGYYSANGVGAGLYRWDDTNTSADNGGTVIAPTISDGTGRWILTQDTPISVTQFGAHGGHNGSVVDDLIPFQKCIQAAKASGANAIYLPPGDYGISGKIDMHSLLGISNSLVNQGYFTIYGDNPGTTRIIPTADITGAMIECVNTGIGNAANARQLRFSGFSLYSDARLNKSADYGFYLKWDAEVFFDNVNVINCCNKRLIYHDTAFVCSFKNCDFVGKANELGDAGSGGAPDGPSNAMNFPPVSYDDRLTGIYFANTSTTTKVDSCRLNSCRIGTNLANGDDMIFDGNAIESNADYGAYLSGSTTNVCFSGNYWEANGANVYISARADTPIFSGNFFHGGAYGIKIVGATILSGIIEGNAFNSSADGIIFDAPAISNIAITRNYFDVDNNALVYPFDTFNSYGNQGHRLDWSDNYIANNAEARRFFRQSKNLNMIDFQDWTLGGAVTRTPSTTKSKVANAYDITYPDQSGYLSSEIAPIGAAINNNLRGSWITILLPIYFTSIYSAQDVGVTFSNSAGDLLCTHTTDFPNLGVVQYGNTGGALPPGLVANTSYTVIRISATTCKLSADGGATNIAYTSAGTGTTTMTFYQPGGKIRVDDGVTQSDFLIGGSDLNVWKTVRAYIKLSSVATTLSLRLYPNRAAFAAENFVVLKGLWGDSEIRSDYNGKMYVHPTTDGAKTPIRLYQVANPSIVIAEMDNPGSPAYGAMRVRDSGGSPVAEMNGGFGFQTLQTGFPFIFFEGPRILSYAGSPEGVKTAAVGSICLDATNGNAYLKRTGAGNTGWAPMSRKRGASVASANDLTLGLDGTSFGITGATNLNGIATASWMSGSEVKLFLLGAITVKHNTAPSAGFAKFMLQGAADFVGASGAVLTVEYDGSVWQETARRTA